MPSTARLLSAMGTDKIHAHRPSEDTTLCGMDVVDAEDYEGENYPPRSADWTGRRYYIGLNRLMCVRCATEAFKARALAESVPLQEVRVL